MPLIQELNVDQLKVPLGFIKIPQLLLAIIAFTSRSGWQFAVRYDCSPGKTIQKTVEGFTIADYFEKCQNAMDKPLQIDHSSAARFFGFICLLSIIYVLVALFVYLFRWGFYAGDDRLPKLDTIITIVLAVGWFLATWIWWGATSALEAETDPTIVQKKFVDEMDFCDKKTCNFKSYAVYAPLTVSVLAGFGCLFLFATNIWYAYKETQWFRERQGPAAAATTPTVTIK